MTRRLYHDDATLKSFSAQVVAHASVGSTPAIVLDATAFYPEAGGQLGDHGTLGGLPVTDTQELDDGRIAHVVSTGELPAIGTEIAGEIAWARRREHMAQHTAQHLLSGALLERAGAPTVSARLGESGLTIDVQRDRIPDTDLASAEDLANAIIDDDLLVRAWFPDPGELAELTLRRDPKVSADIRVVAIGDFDYSPCGGTHASRTSQLGTVRITSAERYKGMTRITFTTAGRGRAELFARDRVLRGLATQFSCSPADVPGAIDQLKRAHAGATTEITTLRSRIAQLMVDTLLAQPGSGAIVATLPVDVEVLRSVAAKLAAAGRDALVCAPDETGAAVVLFRAAGSTRDCGVLWKALAARAGGRGGGKAERAEGRLTTPVDWSSLVTELDR